MDTIRFKRSKLVRFFQQVDLKVSIGITNLVLVQLAETD